MIGRQDRHQLLGDELAQTQPVALHPLGHRQEGEVEHVVAQHLGQLLAGLLAHGQLDARVALMEHGQGQRHVDGTHRVHRPDHHMAGSHPGERLHLGRGRLDLGQDAAGPGDQRPAGLGDRDLPRGALDEGQPDLPLEPPDLLGERRLGDVLAGRGAGEVLLLGERDEVAKLAQFHNWSLYITADVRL